MGKVWLLVVLFALLINQCGGAKSEDTTGHAIAGGAATRSSADLSGELSRLDKQVQSLVSELKEGVSVLNAAAEREQQRRRNQGFKVRADAPASPNRQSLEQYLQKSYTGPLRRLIEVQDRIDSLLDRQAEEEAEKEEEEEEEAEAEEKGQVSGEIEKTNRKNKKLQKKTTKKHRPYIAHVDEDERDWPARVRALSDWLHTHANSSVELRAIGGDSAGAADWNGPARDGSRDGFHIGNLRRARCLATRDLLPGQVYLSVPIERFLTSEQALAKNGSTVGSVLYTDDLCQTLPSLALATHLAFERLAGERSAWSPYVRALPRQLAVPMLFTLAELKELQHSPTYGEVLKLHASAIQQYVYVYSLLQIHTRLTLGAPLLHELLPRFSFRVFRWASATVNSRQQQVPRLFSRHATDPDRPALPGPPIVALVPGMDLCALRLGPVDSSMDVTGRRSVAKVLSRPRAGEDDGEGEKEKEEDGKEKKKEREKKNGKNGDFVYWGPIKKGDEMRAALGDGRSSQSLFLLAGLVPLSVENSADSLSFTVTLNRRDELFAKKKVLLSTTVNAAADAQEKHARAKRAKLRRSRARARRENLERAKRSAAKAGDGEEEDIEEEEGGREKRIGGEDKAERERKATEAFEREEEEEGRRRQASEDQARQRRSQRSVISPSHHFTLPAAFVGGSAESRLLFHYLRVAVMDDDELQWALDNPRLFPVGQVVGERNQKAAVKRLIAVLSRAADLYATTLTADKMRLRALDAPMAPPDESAAAAVGRDGEDSSGAPSNRLVAVRACVRMRMVEKRQLGEYTGVARQLLRLVPLEDGRQAALKKSRHERRNRRKRSGKEAAGGEEDSRSRRGSGSRHDEL